MKYPSHNQGAICQGCEARLREGHQTIQDFFHAIKKENPFVHTCWVFRDQQSQEQAFQAGESKLHYPDSKHNKTPSEAIDLFQINVMGKAIFDPVYCAKVNARAKELGFNLRWGGTFKHLGDAGHFELVDEGDQS